MSKATTTSDYSRLENNAKSAFKDFTTAAGQILYEDQPEFIANTDMMAMFHRDPNFTAAFLMALLPIEAQHDGNELSKESKLFWLQVADAMGPDWVHSFKQVSLFMGRVV